MITSIQVGAKVICTDGPIGSLTALVIDRASHRVTHISVMEKSMLHGEERMVPIDRVIESTRETVRLNCTIKEVLNMAEFTRTHYMEMEGDDGYAYTLPYTSMGGDMMMPPAVSYPVVEDENVPDGGVSLHRGTPVEATDGPVGEVGELILDPQSGQITHFILMKGHGWGKKEIAIGLTTENVAKLADETLYLKISKAQIEKLPSLPLKRDWNEVNATDLELMVWIYDGKDQANQTLEKAEKLSKQYDLDLLSATILEKDAKGNTHVHEQKKVHSKGKMAFGIVLGGLVGMAVGPIALVAGAIAGGAIGKRSANKVEVGFSKEKMEKLNQSLPPGGSALVLLIEHRWFNTLQVEMADTGGQLINERLADVNVDDLADQVQKDES
jgi:uncharacterized membrane protein